MRRLLLFATTIACFLSTKAVAQNCPALPKKTWFDTLAYIKTEVPTDASRPLGIWLGQGTTGGRPGFIPSNHPEWAIGIAHAWNYSRNVNQRVEYPKIGYWMATMLQESELMCHSNATWSTTAQQPWLYTNNPGAVPATVANYSANGGCYQIEGPLSAWSAMGQGYPAGRFPAALYPTLNTSDLSGEVQPMLKAYYDLNTGYVFNYYMGWNFYNNIDCKDVHDAYAYEKMSASAYNGGPNAFLNALTTLNNTGAGCWNGLPATTAGYAEQVAQRVAVVENNTTYCGGWPASSSFGGYYNANITWTNVTTYLSHIALLYPEINFATQVTPKVQAAFIAKTGSLATPVPFQQMGSIIDAIILSLPLERPTPVEGSPMNVDLQGCKNGDFIPVGHVEILDGSTTMCLGNSVTLNLEVDNPAGSAAPTFRWYRNSIAPANLIGSNQTITITPTATGVFTYCAEICNGTGCYRLYSNNANACVDSRNRNGFKITVNNCSSCSFTASATSVNTPCKGMNNGTINLTLTNAPANYKVTYTGSTPLGAVNGTFNSSGNTVAINNLRDGSYNIVLEDLSNATCKAYTNVIVNFTTNVNEYIDAVKAPQGSTSCTANVTATLKELPATCNWRVVAFSGATFQWENWVNFGITTSTGISTMEKWTHTIPAPGFDPWTNAQISEQLLTLNTGDRMDFYLALTNTPGASQLQPYTVRVYDENNNIVHTATANAAAANSGPYKIGTGYTVTCPTPSMPAYTYTWNPALTTMNNTATTSSGTINITFTTPQVYTVTATHPTNSQCKLTDTVIVQPTCPSALPIDLISFNAKVVNKKTVYLDWMTVSESNCKEYIIERSLDGITFEKIGTVNCANRVTINEYQYIDHKPYGGVSYYRVVGYDYDGATTYSDTKQIFIHELIAQIYPNPFNHTVNITLSGSSENQVQINVYDIRGTNVYSTHVNGNSAFVLGEELAAGVYVIEVVDQWQVKQYKVVKQ